jgi:hypothetical protein
MVDRVGGHKWLQQNGNMLDKQRAARLTEGGAQQEKIDTL